MASLIYTVIVDVPHAMSVTDAQETLDRFVETAEARGEIVTDKSFQLVK